MVGDVVNPEMGNVLERKTPDVGGSVATGKGEKTPSHEEDSSKEAEASHGSPRYLIQKQKAGLEVGSKVVVPEPRNIRSRLRSASGHKSFPVSKATSEVPPTGAKGSLSKHLKTFRVSSSFVSEPLLLQL
ncbi:hypothetical protein Hanom_Chr17g01585431 [Helianthus anomalus]